VGFHMLFLGLVFESGLSSNFDDVFLAFACEQDGCRRRFSVISNLRRHKKVHEIKKLSPGL
jgi:hypothetical protein